MHNKARQFAVQLAVSLVLGIGALLRCDALLAASDEQHFSEIERGRYLTTAADCAACHDDPVHHRAFAGGRPIETPFGMVVAPNITPDRETGIGAWSAAQFETLVRQGKMPNGKRIYPAMPFTYFTKMSSVDVHAIYAYLMTVAPMHHKIDADQLPFPFSIRFTMRIWDALYFDAGQFKINSSQSPQWNRGAYLVEGPGHCGACHTPKNFLGGDKHDQEFQGYTSQRWFAPNITNDEKLGLSDWSTADIVEYLKKGHNKIAAASGPMAEEVANSSSRLSDGDVAAMAIYLKDRAENSAETASQKTNNTSARATEDARNRDPVMRAGAAIYEDLCSSCHKADGSGVPYLIPNIAAANSVASRKPTTLLRVVLQGANSVATDAEPTAPAMPAFGWQLSDAQIAAVLTYIRNSWQHSASAVTAHDVHAAREKLKKENRQQS